MTSQSPTGSATLEVFSCVFYLRALLDRVYAQQIRAKCVEAQTQANTPPVLHFLTKYVERSCAQLTFHLWTSSFLNVNPVSNKVQTSSQEQDDQLVKQKCLIFMWRRKRRWWTSKHKMEVTRRWRWPRCCRSGFTGAPELVDQTWPEKHKSDTDRELEVKFTLEASICSLREQRWGRWYRCIEQMAKIRTNSERLWKTAAAEQDAALRTIIICNKYRLTLSVNFVVTSDSLAD